MRQESFQSLGNGSFHRIAYTEWGQAANPHAVVCVHGLARNSRDFDYLAAALTPECRVLCMDVAGRGDSEWLENKSDYTFTLYQNDAAAMLARVGGRKIDWIGTSMGGLIGMMLAARRGSPIRRLVLNDVGAFIPWGALFRLKGYITKGKRFASVAEVEAHLRNVCAPFGPLTDEQWAHLARHGARKTEEGDFQLRYDPAVGGGLHGHLDPEFPMGPEMLRGIDLWNVWSKVECPVLVLRGADSEVLTKKTVDEMRERKPGTEVVEFAGVGHAPALMSEDQIAAVKRFLLQ